MNQSVIPEYKFSVFEEIIQIGVGGEAIVYKGLHVTEKKYFAFKVYKNNTKNQVRETELLIKHSKHENIVKIYGLLIEEDPLKRRMGYFMELMKNGSLNLIIHNADIKYTMRQFYLWIRQTAEGLKYLHRNNIVHRDIKPRNLLIGDSLDVLKISDFGLAKSLDKTISSTTAGKGTPFYMSPEVITSQPCIFPSDIYALSITIWEMYHRKRPYEEFSDKTYLLFRQVVEKKKRPTINGDSSLNKLLRRGWDADPNNRPNLNEFINFTRINLEESNTSRILRVGTNPKYTQPSDTDSMDSDSNKFAGSIEYTFSDFEDITIIGQGGEAEIYKGRHVTEKEYFAIKVIHKMNTKEPELLIKYSNHENIVKVYGLLISEGLSKTRIGYFMEFMENGSLYYIIHNPEIKYTMRQFYLWIRQVAKGLNYLHRNKIIHRDIKPTNLLLGNSLEDLKICDFGFSKSLDKDMSSTTGGIGTLSYMSPEVINSQKYSFPSDIYALSITIWEMFHRKRPYEEFFDESPYWLSKRIIEENKRPPISGDSSLNKLLERGWDVNPNKRPNLSEFLNFTRINLEESDTREQIKNSVMILEGFLCDDICIFNSKQNKWNELHLRLPRKLSAHGSVMINDEIYIFGGFDGQEYFKELYKLGENMEWIQLADMNEKRCSIGNNSVVFDDEIWVFGGYNGTNRLKSVEKYNPKTNTWIMMPEMKNVRNYSAVSIIAGKFYVSGGFDGKNSLNIIEVYDPEEEEWDLFCEMSFALDSHVSVVDGTNLIIIGGDKSQFEPSDEVWKLNVLDPKKQWIKNAKFE